MNQNICSQCGTPNIPNQSFCSNCGRPLTMNQFGRSGGQTPVAAYANAAPPKKSRAGLYLGILAGAGLFVLLIGAAGLAGLYYFVRQSGRETTYKSKPAPTPRSVSDNESPSDDAGSANKDSNNSADLTEDEKYRLFYAASKVGEQALTLKVSKKIGIISEAGSPTPYYKTFIGGIIEWTTRDMEFVQKTDTKQKALDYINSHAPELTASSYNSSQPSKLVSLGVINGKATNLVTPAYPAAAKAVNASGAVNVQVTLDEQGSVTSASAVSGHPLLRASAEQAARASKFSPTVLSGKAVKSSGIIVYNFTVQ